MSFFSATKNFFTLAPADVDKAAKAIYAKADADVASLKKSAATQARCKQLSDSLAAVNKVHAEHVRLLQEAMHAPVPPPVTGAPTPTHTGPTGA